MRLAMITAICCLCFLLFAGCLCLIHLLLRFRSRLEEYQRRFSTVLDAEGAAARIRAQSEQLVSEHEVAYEKQLRAEQEKLARLRVESGEFLKKAAAAIETQNERIVLECRAAHAKQLCADQEELAQIKNEREAYLTNIEQNIAVAKREATTSLAQFEEKRINLEKSYEEALSLHSQLKSRIALLEESTEDLSFGLYQPHFDFTDSESYKEKLVSLRAQQKTMVRAGQATSCPVAWTVGNSVAEGKKMVKQHCKLVLRAFNAECDAALANVTWANVRKMEERIRLSFVDLNASGGVLHVTISDVYRNLKIEELWLKNEYEQKRREEREEQRRIREQIRDEERAEHEIEKAREEAESDEARFQKALDRARQEAARATGEQLRKLTDQVASFEAKLDEARKKKERAISRAQITKSGFVYVISNVGSFGEQVYKIGMTRRMDPMERVYELGDASVPFPFDLHVMFYSDNAPELECALQKLFEKKRLNLVNARREFYKDIDLGDIKAFAEARGLSAQFVEIAEAREYRQTIAHRQILEAQLRISEPLKSFPDQLFVPDSR